MTFNLLQLYCYADFWIDICGIETDWGDGSLLLINRHYDGTWSFDFLYFRLSKYIYRNWRNL